MQLNKSLKIMEENIKNLNIYIDKKSNKIIYKLSYSDSIL